MKPDEEYVELKPGVVMLCDAFGPQRGHHVFMLLERLPGLTTHWRCLLLDSDNVDLLPGGFYYPDESYLWCGRPVG